MQPQLPPSTLQTLAVAGKPHQQQAQALEVASPPAVVSEHVFGYWCLFNPELNHMSLTLTSGLKYLKPKSQSSPSSLPGIFHQQWPCPYHQRRSHSLQWHRAGTGTLAKHGFGLLQIWIYISRSHRVMLSLGVRGSSCEY